jgi:hypothetical protein
MVVVLLAHRAREVKGDGMDGATALFAPRRTRRPACDGFGLDPSPVGSTGGEGSGSGAGRRTRRVVAHGARRIAGAKLPKAARVEQGGQHIASVTTSASPVNRLAVRLRPAGWKRQGQGRPTNMALNHESRDLRRGIRTSEGS